MQNNNLVGAVRVCEGDRQGVFLESPFYLPVFDEDTAAPPPPPIVPKATPIPPQGKVELSFFLPQGNIVGYTILGWWAFYAVLSTETPNPLFPLVWADPDAGIANDMLPIPPAGNPGFIGAREGHRFSYSLMIGGNPTIDRTHHGQYKDHWRTLPVPIEVPSGAEGKLTIIREACTNFAPDDYVYLFFGLFGRERYTFPPPEEIDSTRQPTRNIFMSTGTVAVPAGAGAGIMGQSVITPVRFPVRHPIVLDGIVHTGDDQVYLKFYWQNGRAMPDFVPARLFNWNHSGRLVAPIVTKAPTEIQCEYAQPLIDNLDQPARSCALGFEGGGYGW